MQGYYHYAELTQELQVSSLNVRYISGVLFLASETYLVELSSPLVNDPYLVCAATESRN